MIDNFALGLIHLLLGIAVWRLLLRPELDTDPEDVEVRSRHPVKPPRNSRRDRR